ncbi:MAG: hypothetical protein MUC59_05740 [Saprospiraceae bacterium]|jgi:hypothetical protein|nr:hypothetical protein [Saprospiraceae bacterium]
MVLIIESSNTEAIQAISAMAKALNVRVKVEPDESVVSKTEIHRRVKALKPFKGALKQFETGYQPNKYDWYQQ